MKGIMLAGGPATDCTRSHARDLQAAASGLRQAHYYLTISLSTLMLAGIRRPGHLHADGLLNFERLRSGRLSYGVNLSYAEQRAPDGLAQAFTIGEGFIAGEPSCALLGDNIFYGTACPAI